MQISSLSDKQIQCFQDSDARINIFEGPVRAGKSFIALLRWIEFCRTGPPGALIICGRTDKTIKRNIINPLQDLVGDAVRYSSGKGEVQMFNRLMYVIGANDDRAEAKIRGSEFAGALIDELTLLPENFCKMLLSRLSVPKASLFASTNPDSPFHWVKTDIIDREKDLNCKVFSFSIDDNPSLSSTFKDELKKEYQGLWFKRYIEGKWVMAEGAVYDFFDEDINVMKIPTDVANYYIVGVDYGTTNPCVFVLIGYNPSVYPNMWLEKEYHYDSKKHQRQKSDYEYSNDLIEFIDGYNVEAIYIDPSAASFKQELRRNDVKHIRDAKNDVVPGIRFQGQLLTNGTYKICSNCVETIKEYTNYVWDSKASQRGEDKPVKQNDHCFVGDTEITTLTGPIPIKNIEAGELVLTPVGYKEVLHVFTHDDFTYEFDIFGCKVQCTETHKFYTANRGWVEVKDMLYSDIILTHNENSEWKKKPSYLTESSIIGTYAPRITKVECIIDHLSQIRLKDMTICIETSGSFTMEKFHQECIYITGMEIPSTMTLITLISSLPKSMQDSIGKCFLKNRRTIEESTSLKLDTSRKSGIPAQKGAHGTDNMPSKVLQNPLIDNSNASNVESSIPQLEKEVQSFVVISAKVNGEEIINLMMSLEYARCVLKNLQLINTQSLNHVPSLVEESCIGSSIQLKENIYPLNVDFANENLTNTMQLKGNSALHRVLLNSGKKQNVYSLHVKDFHAYYAHNILTLNCKDAERYALFSHFFERTGTRMTEEEADSMEKAYGWKKN